MTGFGLSDLKILVIDDNRSIRAVITALLSPYGEITAAENSGVAIAEMKTRGFDWIVSDLSLPDTKFRDAAVWIRQIDQHRGGAQVIINSVNGSQEVQSLCERLSFHRVEKGDHRAIEQLVSGGGAQNLDEPAIKRIARGEAVEVVTEMLHAWLEASNGMKGKEPDYAASGAAFTMGRIVSGIGRNLVELGQKAVAGGILAALIYGAWFLLQRGPG